MKILLTILLLSLAIGALLAYNSSEMIEYYRSYADDTEGTNCVAVPAVPVPSACSVTNTGPACTIIVSGQPKYIFAESDCIAVFRRP